MPEFFYGSEWRISENRRRLETGDPRTGVVTIGLDEIAGLLVTNEPALMTFLQELSQASAKRFGEQDFLVRLLGTYAGAHPPLLTLAEIVNQGNSS